MVKLTGLLKAVDQLRQLDNAKMRLVEQQWAYEIEIDRLRTSIEDQRSKISDAKEEIWTKVQALKLNRREDAPNSTDEFCDAVSDWIGRAVLIRKDKSIIHLDGNDLDVPDIDIKVEMPPLRSCFPCKIHRKLLETLNKLKPEYRETLRIRYSISDDERYSATPGFIPYQNYVAQQLGISESSVSRRLKKAIRALRHPYFSDELLALSREIEICKISCAAEYMILHIFGSDAFRI